jgi:glucose dehydrogenase
MYIVTPYPNIVYALDLSKPGAPMKWKYEPKPEPAPRASPAATSSTAAPPSPTARIFFNTLDGHTIALDANSGKDLAHEDRQHHIGETITMAPLVVKGKVLVGNSGGELGVRGWLTALDAARQVAWRAYSTGPRQGRADRPRLQALLRFGPGKDLGVTSWPAKPGRSAAATCGASSPTIPTST